MDLENILLIIETNGYGDYSDPPDGAFDKLPPDWAKDPFNGDSADICGYCGSWMDSVRPGKSQCNTCWDGTNIKYLAREAMKLLERDYARRETSQKMSS